MKKLIVVGIIASVMLSSCVSNKKYAELEGNFNKKSQELVDVKADLMKCNIESEGKISSLEQQITDLRKDKEKTLEYVDNLTVLSKSASENIKETLAQMGKKDEYITYIQKAITRKDSINVALGFKLKSVLKDGFHDEDIQVDVEKTVVYISIADKLLFKSGSATISKDAKNVLGKVAEVIAAQPDLEVMVEGYTDSKPISTAGIKDNWDLSVKRSTAVVRVLQKDFSIEPSRLIAAGRSEYMPLESNDTVEGRARNRRTRIVLMPKLEQFFDLLENKVN
jgi:chemotaxis protein MotB